ncbi:MAG: Spy/CpxP family protein refolding chaperone [Candidatus Dadabacteria bacterium]|nr:Spy/CpxP family protein refolding chaperone [Candidatus Dadabacteria bacterium]
MTKVISLLFVTFLLFSFATYGFSGKQYGKHENRNWWNNTKVLDQLKLTDQQKGKIDEIASSNKERLDNLRSQIKTYHKELDESAKNPNSTRDQILSEFDQLEKTRGELRKVEFEMSMEMREVLTPEQKTTLSGIKEQHKKRQGSEKCDE